MELSQFVRAPSEAVSSRLPSGLNWTEWTALPGVWTTVTAGRCRCPRRRLPFERGGRDAATVVGELDVPLWHASHVRESEDRRPAGGGNGASQRVAPLPAGLDRIATASSASRKLSSGSGDSAAIDCAARACARAVFSRSIALRRSTRSATTASTAVIPSAAPTPPRRARCRCAAARRLAVMYVTCFVVGASLCPPWSSSQFSALAQVAAAKQVAAVPVVTEPLAGALRQPGVLLDPRLVELEGVDERGRRWRRSRPPGAQGSSSAARATAVSASPSTERRRTGMIRLLSSSACCKLFAADVRRERVRREDEHHRPWPTRSPPRHWRASPTRRRGCPRRRSRRPCLAPRAPWSALLDELLVLAGVGEENVGAIPSGTWRGRTLRAA